MCKGDGDSLLKGNNGNLVFSYPTINKTWVAKPKNMNGDIIKTNSELGNLLIIIYNKYGELFQLDPNVLAAQAYIESNYKLWIYPDEKLNSTAVSITQFLQKTLYDIVVRNIYRKTVGIEFSENEIKLITLGCEGNIRNPLIFNINNKLGRINREVILQNSMDNPDIMIKAQFVYMKQLSKLSNKLASLSLFGYSRGHAYLKPTYTDTINYTRNVKGDEYCQIGIDYVFKVFNYLGNPKYSQFGYFGYDKSPYNVNCDISAFNQFNAEVDESNTLY